MVKMGEFRFLVIRFDCASRPAI